jgi:type IV secretory pathway TrbF-like protein
MPTAAVAVLAIHEATKEACADVSIDALRYGVRLHAFTNARIVRQAFPEATDEEVAAAVDRFLALEREWAREPLAVESALVMAALRAEPASLAVLDEVAVAYLSDAEANALALATEQIVSVDVASIVVEDLVVDDVAVSA